MVYFPAKILKAPYLSPRLFPSRLCVKESAGKTLAPHYWISRKVDSRQSSSGKALEAMNEKRENDFKVHSIQPIGPPLWLFTKATKKIIGVSRGIISRCRSLVKVSLGSPSRSGKSHQLPWEGFQTGEVKVLRRLTNKRLNYCNILNPKWLFLSTSFPFLCLNHSKHTIDNYIFTAFLSYIRSNKKTLSWTSHNFKGAMWRGCALRLRAALVYAPSLTES